VIDGAAMVLNNSRSMGNNGPSNACPSIWVCWHRYVFSGYFGGAAEIRYDKYGIIFELSPASFADVRANTAHSISTTKEN
jgi:hypothetical protein